MLSAVFDSAQIAPERLAAGGDGSLACRERLNFRAIQHEALKEPRDHVGRWEPLASLDGAEKALDAAAALREGIEREPRALACGTNPPP